MFQNTIWYNKKYIGKTEKVLVETKLKNGYYDGLTNNYIRVLIESNEELQKGEIYNIYLNKLDKNSIIGNRI